MFHLRLVVLVVTLACTGSQSDGHDSAVKGVALPLGATASTGWDAAEEYRQRADEYAKEHEVLRRSETRVLREPGILRIVPRVGDTVVIWDSIAEGDAYVRFVYAAFHPTLGIHVIGVHYHEGGGALIVLDSTGRQTHVAEIPLVSPDSARFAVVSIDLEAGYQPNRLEIWRPVGDTLLREFAHEFGPAVGPDSAAWRSGNTLRFVRTRYISITSYERTPSSLVRRESGWHLEPPPR